MIIYLTNHTKYNLVPLIEGAYIDGLFGGKIVSIKSKIIPLFSSLDNSSNFFSSISEDKFIDFTIKG